MEFIKRVSNGVLFPIDQYGHLAGSEGYVRCDANGVSLEPVIGSAKEEKSGSDLDADRMLLIMDAINQIDPATFNKATVTSPAMPKVAAVSALIGGPVTAAEIKQTILTMG